MKPIKNLTKRFVNFVGDCLATFIYDFSVPAKILVVCGIFGIVAVVLGVNYLYNNLIIVRFSA